MQDGRSALAVCSASCIFLVLSFSLAHGENLFHWKDEAGRPCYSNVSPPAGVKTFSVDTASHSVSNRPPPEKKLADIKTAEEIPAETSGTSSNFAGEILDQRISERKKSIGHIEALLRKHPDDPALRRGLFKKRQYLFEDISRLKNSRP